VSVNENKWLVMHMHMHVQLQLDELRGASGKPCPNNSTVYSNPSLWLQMCTEGWLQMCTAHFCGHKGDPSQPLSPLHITHPDGRPSPPWSFPLPLSFTRSTLQVGTTH
jgi:hypothetical protein